MSLKKNKLIRTNTSELLLIKKYLNNLLRYLLFRFTSFDVIRKSVAKISIIWFSEYLSLSTRRDTEYIYIYILILSVFLYHSISMHIIAYHVYSYVYFESVDIFKEVTCCAYVGKASLDELLPFVLISARSLYRRHICVYRQITAMIDHHRGKYFPFHSSR